jgi:DNA-binding CsgD family transcriptional regulator/biotin operon repressor
MTMTFSSGDTLPAGAAVPSLVRWGLSVDADLVFRTLTTFGPRSQHVLASELGLSRQRTADAVAELGAAGAAINVTDGGSSRPGPVWKVRPPAEVIAGLRARRMRLVDPARQAVAHRGLVHTLTERLDGIGVAVTASSIGGTLSDTLRYLPSRELARNRLAELNAAQRYDRLVINTEQSFDAEAQRAGVPGIQPLVDRNIQMRVLEVPPADGDMYQPGEEYVNQTTFQVREALVVPLKLFVLDHRVALFPMDPLDPDRGYLEVSQPGVVDSLVAVFERHWSTATDPLRYGVPQIVLSEREQALIALLGAGHTDVSAAGQLRISARTVTNVMRALMDRVGVDNRFQLGLTLGTLRAAAPPAFHE